jgi:hypothetical protein
LILNIVNDYLFARRPQIGVLIVSIAYGEKSPKNINDLISFH